MNCVAGHGADSNGVKRYCTEKYIFLLTIVCDIHYNKARGDNVGEKKETLENLLLELRRGTLVLSVLSQLKEPKYGYALVQGLEGQGVRIETNTLYPLLRRLEKQGLLASDWETGGSKPRKYYRRTASGDEVYKELKEQWQGISRTMEKLLEEN